MDKDWSLVASSSEKGENKHKWLLACGISWPQNVTKVGVFMYTFMRSYPCRPRLWHALFFAEEVERDFERFQFTLFATLYSLQSTHSQTNRDGELVDWRETKSSIGWGDLLCKSKSFKISFNPLPSTSILRLLNKFSTEDKPPVCRLSHFLRSSQETQCTGLTLQTQQLPRRCVTSIRYDDDATSLECFHGWQCIYTAQVAGIDLLASEVTRCYLAISPFFLARDHCPGVRGAVDGEEEEKSCTE